MVRASVGTESSDQELITIKRYTEVLWKIKNQNRRDIQKSMSLKMNWVTREMQQGFAAKHLKPWLEISMLRVNANIKINDADADDS